MSKSKIKIWHKGVIHVTFLSLFFIFSKRVVFKIAIFCLLKNCLGNSFMQNFILSLIFLQLVWVEEIKK